MIIIKQVFEPLSKEEISSLKTLTAKRNKFFLLLSLLIMLGTFVLSWFSFMKTDFFGSQTYLATVLSMIMSIGLGVFLGLLIYFLSPKRNGIDICGKQDFFLVLNDFDKINGENALEILDYCENYNEVKDYASKVNAFDREILNIDYKIIKYYIEGWDERKAFEKLQAY